MSMSTLGNQLAALSSASTSNNNAGIVNSTSRTNNDGIGRGFHHSNKVGYSTLMNGGGGDGVKRRPSILYDNARDAAEVSLATLHENAISSLSHLSSSCNEASTATTLQRQQQLWNDAQFINTQNGLLSLNNLNNFERGTSTLQENELVDASIVQLLKLLMTMVTECIPPPSSSSSENDYINSNPILLSCLHIIEYLLRKYEIHTRPLTSSMLLQTILPLQIIYPSSYTQLFKRVISLMDLTLLPTWTFLRPYVAQGAPSVNRNMLSKFVAKDDSLALCIANIGKYGMEICIKECKLRMEEEKEEDYNNMMVQIDDDGGVMDNNSKVTNTTGALIVRRGISSLISFSASTLVEAIHIQSSSKDAGIGGGGVQESLVRVLYPLVLSACKSGGSGSSSSGYGDGLYYYCPEWKEWGRILTSTISILCPLKHDAKIGLCDAIVDGLPLVELSLHGGGGKKGKKTKTKKNSFQEAVQDVATGKASSLSTAIKDDASSAIMTLLSVLGTMTNDVNDGDDDDDESLEYYLPILPPKKKKHRHRNTTTTIIDYMGCELPPSTYKRLSKDYGTSMAMYLGSVLQILRGEDGDEDDEDEDEDDNPIIVERMAPLVASIIMHAFSRLEKEAGKVLSSTSPKKRKSKSKGGEEEKDVMKCKADRDVLLILSLVSCFLLFSALVHV